VTRLAIPVSLALTVYFAACTAHTSIETRPEAKLTGKWEEVASAQGRRYLVQFEFFADGTAIENHKTIGIWDQYTAGSLKFIDATHIKVELQPTVFFGVAIYEVIWKDQDYLTLRAADKVIQLTRIKS
jgi:hypothetical protein